MISNQLVQETRSHWLRQDNNIILMKDYVEERGTVSLHSTDRDMGYPCLEVQPFLGLSAVLNLKRNEMIGKPCEVSGFIGSKKREAIEQAIASKGRVKVFYDWRWGETPSTIRKWEMCITAMYQGVEVLVITENLNAHQKEYWRDIASASQND